MALDNYIPLLHAIPTTYRELATSLRQLLDYYVLLLHAIPTRLLTTTATIRQLLTTTSSYFSTFVCLDINSGIFWTMFQNTDNVILIKVSD